MGNPVYPKVYAWVKEYANYGSDDARAVTDYMTVESQESIVGLRGELTSISKGNFDEGKMDVFVGVPRKSKHGGYDKWAKMMLLWMAGFKG